MPRRKIEPVKILFKPKGAVDQRTDAWFAGQSFSDTRTIGEAYVKRAAAPNKSAVFCTAGATAPRDKLRGFWKIAEDGPRRAPKTTLRAR